MLKRIRVICATACLIIFALLFAGMTFNAFAGGSFLAKIQIVPAILSGSIGVVLILILFTAIFGRVYCSVLCPLGLLQDVISRLKRKRRFHYTPGRTGLRVALFLVFVAAFAFGISLLAHVLEPYSAFGRITTQILAPLRAVVREVPVSGEATGMEPPDMASFLTACATLAVIGLLAWRSGRFWCNTFCPVGTGLGAISRFSLLKPRIDHASCVKCGKCSAACKSSCIDLENGRVETSRCVSCFTCLSACGHGSIRYGFKGRQFLPASSIQTDE